MAYMTSLGARNILSTARNAGERREQTRRRPRQPL